MERKIIETRNDATLTALRSKQHESDPSYSSFYVEPTALGPFVMGGSGELALNLNLEADLGDTNGQWSIDDPQDPLPPLPPMPAPLVTKLQ